MKQSKKQELIKLATSFIGVQEEGGNNSGPVVEMFQRVIGRAEKEPWCVSFVQYCVKEIDKRMKTNTVLFPTESSQMLWVKTPKVARIEKPAPGCIVVWTSFKNDKPTAFGHVGIVREVLDKDWMLTVEGNTGPDSGSTIVREGDGVYMKRRRISQKTGTMRTCGFLLPWAD